MKPYQMLNGRWIDLHSITSISDIWNEDIWNETYFEINCKFHEGSILIQSRGDSAQEDEIVFLRTYNHLVEAWKKSTNPEQKT